MLNKDFFENSNQKIKLKIHAFQMKKIWQTESFN